VAGSDLKTIRASHFYEHLAGNHRVSILPMRKIRRSQRLLNLCRFYASHSAAASALRRRTIPTPIASRPGSKAGVGMGTGV